MMEQIYEYLRGIRKILDEIEYRSGETSWKNECFHFLGGISIENIKKEIFFSSDDVIIERLGEEVSKIIASIKLNSEYVSNIKTHIAKRHYDDLERCSNIDTIRTACFTTLLKIADVLGKDIEINKVSLGEDGNSNNSNENHDSEICLMDDNVITEIYNKCNDKLWNSINKEDFSTMLKTGNINITIKPGNKQRVLALMNRVSMLITNNAQWVNTVERSLRIERLSKIRKLDEMNSKTNKEFNDFLAKIHPL